jgi:hypothetical protein
MFAFLTVYPNCSCQCFCLQVRTQLLILIHQYELTAASLNVRAHAFGLVNVYFVVLQALAVNIALDLPSRMRTAATPLLPHLVPMCVSSVRHGYGYGSEISHRTCTRNNRGYTVKGIHRTRIFTGTYSIPYHLQYTVSLITPRGYHQPARFLSFSW